MEATDFKKINTNSEIEEVVNDQTPTPQTSKTAEADINCIIFTQEHDKPEAKILSSSDTVVGPGAAVPFS